MIRVGDRELEKAFVLIHSGAYIDLCDLPETHFGSLAQSGDRGAYDIAARFGIAAVTGCPEPAERGSGTEEGYRSHRNQPLMAVISSLV